MASTSLHTLQSTKHGKVANKKGSLLEADVLSAVFALWSLREPKRQLLLSAISTLVMAVREVTAPSYTGLLNATSMASDYYEFWSNLQVGVSNLPRRLLHSQGCLRGSFRRRSPASESRRAG